MGGAGDAEEEVAVDVDGDGTGDVGTTLGNAFDGLLAACVALLGSGEATATMLVGVATALIFSRALGVSGGAAFFFVGFSGRDEGAYL